MTTMTLSDLKTPYVDFHMEGAIEEMRKDRRIYQKRWRLHFRSFKCENSIYDSFAVLCYLCCNVLFHSTDNHSSLFLRV